MNGIEIRQVLRAGSRVCGSLVSAEVAALGVLHVKQRTLTSKTGLLVGPA